jgi:hypothetical protein
MQRTPRLRLCYMPGIIGAGSLIRDVRRLRMRDTTFVIEVLEVFFGTLGVGLVVFGIARGIHANEKLAFIPVGLALAALVVWNQRKRKKKATSYESRP